ncbi:MAG TPA: transcriptional regulator [Methanospirillum sp.]|nr:transcriptional regulator [Methanospirillum sp.]
MRKDDFLEIIHAASDLNSQTVSLIRIMILWALNDVSPDGVTARQLKGALQAHEGSLYSNLDALEEMGYIQSQMTRFESKEIKMYTITPAGLEEWKKLSGWLQMITRCHEEEQ